jgi:hypothetical protein
MSDARRKPITLVLNHAPFGSARSAIALRIWP